MKQGNRLVFWMVIVPCSALLLLLLVAAELFVGK